MLTTLDDRNHPHPSLSRSTGRGGCAFLVVALPPFILLAALTGCCYLAAGPSLGLYLGGLALGMTLTPPFVVAHVARVERVLAVGSLIDGVGVVWLVAMFRSDVTFGQWLAAYVLLAACAIGAAGLTLALSRWVGALFASALATVIVLAWLAWPIWLSAWIDRPSVVIAIGWLVPVHPLLSLNGLLAHLGVWGEGPLMYQLTSLGQDVPYSLPSSIAICAGAHVLLGGALLLVSRAREPRATIDEPDRHAR
ncbi:MAG: hypothetical protein M3478_09190 [Planctomycetota bacterium]|nr:hypothetical protein [Planctomycetota bacterium]